MTPGAADTVVVQGHPLCCRAAPVTQCPSSASHRPVSTQFPACSGKGPIPAPSAAPSRPAPPGPVGPGHVSHCSQRPLVVQMNQTGRELTRAEVEAPTVSADCLSSPERRCRTRPARVPWRRIPLCPRQAGDGDEGQRCGPAPAEGTSQRREVTDPSEAVPVTFPMADQITSPEHRAARDGAPFSSAGSGDASAEALIGFCVTSRLLPSHDSSLAFL